MIQVLDVAQGLEYLHTMNPHIIHGDLKGVCKSIPFHLFLYLLPTRQTYLSRHRIEHVLQILGYPLLESLEF